MKYVPHEYQQAAISFALDHPKCLLSLDMGLGKTSVTLSVLCELLDDFAVNRVLIIAPKFVAQDVWIREAKKWDFASGLQIAVAVGTAAQRRAAVESGAEIVCINRENVSWLVDLYRTSWPFDCIVVDESSSFKSYSSQRFKALRKVTPAASRIIELTGTPRPRSLEDLWPQIYLLDHGERLERSMTAFRTRFEMPGRRNGQQIWEWIPRPGAEDTVYGLISDISMSMKAEDWLSVPELTEIDHYVELPPKLRKIYRELEHESILRYEDHAIVGANAGVLAGKLLQFANGAVYDDHSDVQEYHDLKLQLLDEILEATEEPVMVFYWFRHDYERLRRFFANYQPRTISSPEDISDWNEGRIRLLLVHPASMGHGLNLQDGGHTIVWFGLTWSLEIYQQANARLHRQGQKHPVMIHRLVMKDTVDEDVLASLDRKDTGQEQLIEAIKARIEGSAIRKKGGQKTK